MRNTFGFGTMNVAAFDTFLGQHEAYFPAYFGRPSFLDNHDQNRFLWLAKGDTRKLKLAALCQFTLPGAPIVYNGTEVGVSQTRDKEDASGVGMAEVRQPMVWGDDQDKSLLDYYKWLIDLRRQHPVLRQGKRQTLHVDTAGTYVYAVYDDVEVVVAAFNLGDQEQSITVPVPNCSESKTFVLPPWGGAVQVTSYN
jgi:glycosidase